MLKKQARKDPVCKSLLCMKADSCSQVTSACLQKLLVKKTSESRSLLKTLNVCKTMRWLSFTQRLVYHNLKTNKQTRLRKVRLFVSLPVPSRPLHIPLPRCFVHTPPSLHPHFTSDPPPPPPPPRAPHPSLPVLQPYIAHACPCTRLAYQ